MDTYREIPDHILHRPPWRADGVLRARHPIRHAGVDYAPGDWMGTSADLGWDERLTRIHWEQKKLDTYDPTHPEAALALLAIVAGGSIDVPPGEPQTVRFTATPGERVSVATPPQEPPGTAPAPSGPPAAASAHAAPGRQRKQPAAR